MNDDIFAEEERIPRGLMERMQCVMRHSIGGEPCWAARACNSEHYAYGETAAEAMRAALPRARRRLDE